MLPALACTMLACGDFSLVPRRDAVPTHALISAYADHRLTESRYRVLLSFQPGIDSATGRAFVISDSSVRIADSVLTYERVLRDGRLQSILYRWEIVRDSSQPPIDTLTIRLPVLARSMSGNPTVHVALPRRGEPRVLTLTDEVALHVLGYAVDSAGADSTLSHWVMDVRTECRDGESFVSVSASTPFPGEMRVPRSWLPATMTGSAMACFLSTTTFEARRLAIPTTVYRQGNIEWLLRLR